MTVPRTPLPYSPPAPPNGKSVLVVDDEPVIRLLARLALTAAGFAVVEAGDATIAEQALDRATAPFDVILLDLTLGETDGSELIPLLRRRMPGAAIVLVTGHGEEMATELGADGFLPKPFAKAALLAAVRAALDRSDG